MTLACLYAAPGLAHPLPQRLVVGPDGATIEKINMPTTRKVVTLTNMRILTVHSQKTISNLATKPLAPSVQGAECNWPTELLHFYPCLFDLRLWDNRAVKKDSNCTQAEVPRRGVQAPVWNT